MDEAKERESFIAYLEGTLIPDLYDSGRDATAEDFQTLVHFLRARGPTTIGLAWTRDEFVDYLENTLIPDLYDSGRDATAEDFEQGIALLPEDKPAAAARRRKLVRGLI